MLNTNYVNYPNQNRYVNCQNPVENRSSFFYHEQEIETTFSYIKQTISNPIECKQHISRLSDLLTTHLHKIETHVMVDYQFKIHDIFVSVINNKQYLTHTDYLYHHHYELHSTLVCHLFENLGCHINPMCVDFAHIGDLFSDVKWQLENGKDIKWAEQVAIKFVSAFSTRLNRLEVQCLFDLATEAVYCTGIQSDVATAPHLAAKIIRTPELWMKLSYEQRESVYVARMKVQQPHWEVWHECNSTVVAFA